jgi:hypothetical protein
MLLLGRAGATPHQVTESQSTEVAAPAPAAEVVENINITLGVSDETVGALEARVAALEGKFARKFARVELVLYIYFQVLT